MGVQKQKEGNGKWETQDTTTRRFKSRRRENKVETDRSATSGSDVVGSPHRSPTTQLSFFFFPVHCFWFSLVSAVATLGVTLLQYLGLVDWYLKFLLRAKTPLGGWRGEKRRLASWLALACRLACFGWPGGSGGGDARALSRLHSFCTATRRLSGFVWRRVDVFHSGAVCGCSCFFLCVLFLFLFRFMFLRDADDLSIYGCGHEMLGWLTAESGATQS